MNQFWAAYKKLEDEILNLSYYVQITDEYTKIKEEDYQHCQFNTYSNEIADLLILTSVQIEALYLRLYKTTSCTEENPESIGAAAKYLNNLWSLDKKQVILSSVKMKITCEQNKIIAPFNYRNGDMDDFYSAYNAVKQRNRGTLRFLCFTNFCMIRDVVT